MNPSDHEFELERQLREVPVPGDLVARLQCIPEAAEIDAALDSQLSAVEIPDNLVPQLHQIAGTPVLVTRSIRERSGAQRQPSISWAVAMWASAAAILVAFGIGWTLQMQQNRGLASNDVTTDPVANHLAPATPTESQLELEWLGLTNDEVAQSVSAPNLTELAEANLLAPSLSQVSLPASLASPPQPVNIHSLSEELPHDLLANTFLMRWQPLGANPAVASSFGMPQMIMPSSSPVTFLPETKQYDRDFLLREASHPFTSPQDPAVRATKVAVTTSQESFENVVFSERPWSPELLENARTEEWLSATGKFYVPGQPGKVELRTAAGPAVFARAGTQLLQVGVVAGSADPKDRSPVHLTIAITPPENEEHALRTWMPVKIALRETIENLQPHDTLTLVVMSEFPYALIEDATLDHRDQWFAALDQIEPGQASNLAEGIRFAAATSLTKPGFGDIRRPLIVLSDRFPSLDQATNRQLRPLIENASQQGIDFAWIQLENENYSSILPPPAALDGMGRWLVTNSLRRLNRFLDQQVHGASTLLGTDAEVTVKWNAKSVGQYRLIGYQPVGGDFVATSHTREIHAGESATLLFELVLPEDGPNDVATIDLTWHDTEGKLQKASQKVSRLQFASSWQATPMSLQAAQLTEQCLALHQNSYFSRRRGNTTDELENWTSSLNPAFKQHASYPRLELLLPGLPD
ncbi:hypothetical protein [Bremerella cremea]|uniref:hypothetical protein n=1 Tax=Bremerella cremea TaxID=1031537 RepID=UPI0031EC8E5E